MEFLKNVLLHICLALWLLPLLFVKLSGILRSKLKRFHKDTTIGAEDFTTQKIAKEINHSPTEIKKDKKELQRHLEWCYGQLQIHTENQNAHMIGFVNAEIRDLEKQLKK